MAAVSIEDINIKGVIAHLNSLKGVDTKQVKQNIHTLDSISGYIIKFYKITGEIAETISKYGANASKQAVDAQKSLMDSVGKAIDIVAGLKDKKFPNMISFRFKVWKFKKEVSWLVKAFIGEGGVCDILNQFGAVSGTVNMPDPDDPKKTKSVKVVSAKEALAAMGNFEDMVKSVENIVKMTENLTKKVIKVYAPAQVGFGLLIYGAKKQPGILESYLDIVTCKPIKELGYKKNQDKIENANKSIQSISQIIQSIANTGSVGNMLGLFMFNNMVLPLLIKTIGKIDEFDAEVQKSSINKKTVEKMTLVNDIVTQFASIVNSLGKLGLGAVMKAIFALMFIGPLIWAIKKIVRKIGKFSEEVAQINVKNVTKQLAQVSAIIDSLLGIVGGVLLLALAGPIVLLAFLPAMATLAVLALVVWAIAKLTVIISRILNGAAGKKTMEGLVVMMMLIGVMLLAGAMVLLLALMGAEFFMDNNWLLALGMFLVVGAVVLAIAGLGYLIALMVPGIAAFTTGIVLVLISITAMLLIGLELKLLAKFDFDESERDQIKSTTIAIIGAARDVMDAMFSDNVDEPRKKENVFTRVFKSIFKGAAMIVEALASSIILVFTVISVTMMLLLALELKWLVQLGEGIDRNKVKSTTTIIMGAAQDVIDAIFEPDAGANTEGGGDGGKMKGPLAHFFTGLADILELIAGVIKVALSMVAIALIRLLGSELAWVANFKIPIYDENGRKEGEVQGGPDQFRDKVLTNVNVIMSTANAVIDAIFEPADNKDTPGGSGFLGALKHFFTGLVDILELIAAIGKLALSMLAIALVKMLGEQLAKIGAFDTSLVTQVPQKVGDIMSSAQACINAINKPADKSGGEGDGFLKKLLKWVLPDSLVDMIDVLLKIGKLAMMVTCVGMIHKLAEQLNTIAGVKFNEKAVRDKVDTIMSCSNVCINQVLHGDKFSKPSREERNRLDELEDLAKFMEKLGKNMNKLSNAMSGLDPKKLQESVKVLTTKITDQNGRSGSFMELTLSYVNDIAEYNLDQTKYYANIAAIDKMISTIKKMQAVGVTGNLDKYKEGIDKAIEFTNVISNARLDNLQTATNMFEKMAEFSKSINGNFEGLADAINEDIVPLLEKLNETLEKTGDSIDNFEIPTIPIGGIGGGTGPGGTGGGAVSGGTGGGAGVNYKNDLSNIKKQLTDIVNALNGVINVRRVTT